MIDNLIVLFDLALGFGIGMFFYAIVDNYNRMDYELEKAKLKQQIFELRQEIADLERE